MSASRPRLAVIGGGMAGISLAARVAEDFEVTVLEAEAQPAYHSSGRSAAVAIECYENEVVRALTVPSMAVPRGTAWEYQYEVFYIRDDVIPQLSRKVLFRDGTVMKLETENIAEGVEDLRVTLGYDSNSDGEVDTFKTPTTLTSWSDVQSVEVFMLTRSATKDVQYTDTKVYRLGGTTVGPKNDNYRRLISYASISLRNLKLIIRGGA